MFGRLFVGLNSFRSRLGELYVEVSGLARKPNGCAERVDVDRFAERRKRCVESTNFGLMSGAGLKRIAETLQLYQ